MGLNLCDRCVADCRHERNLDEIVIKCGVYKPPMTNADRIRAMSDEKLAEQLVVAVNGLQPCTLYYSMPTERTFLTEAEAVRVTLEWLQQPAEEDT